MGLIQNIRSNIQDVFRASAIKQENGVLRKAITDINAVISSRFSGSRNAMSGGDYRSGGAKFRDGLSASGQSIFLDHQLMRTNVRKAMQDSVEARMIPERMADSVVDRGLILESTPKFDILGITEDEAEAWARNVESRFHLWAKSKTSHRSQTNNFYQNQWLYHYWQQRDSDLFVRFHYSKNSYFMNPLQISFVDPDQVRGCAYTTTMGLQLNNDDGIVRDSSGVEIGYKIWERIENSYEYKPTEIPAFGSKSGRVMMLHGYRQEYVGQTRGIPRLAPFLQEFENITDLSISKILKAISQSNFVGVIENKQQDPSNFLESTLQDRGAGIAQSTSTTPTAEIIDTGTEFSFSRLQESTSVVPGSTIIANMKKGDEFKYLQDNAPGESYSSFVGTFFTHLSASVGIPVEVALMKFNQNYSASRATLIMFWRLIGIWKAEMESDFLNPTFEMWLSEEIAAGKIQAPGWNNPTMRAAWLSCNWIGAPMPNIDPMRTAKSDQMYMEMRATTGKRIAREYNGSDWSSNATRVAKEFKQMELFPSPWTKNPQQAAPPAGE